MAQRITLASDRRGAARVSRGDQRRQRDDLRALPGLALVRQADQVLRDLGAQRLEACVVVHLAAVARALDVDA